jgi:hypothetical protein
MRLRIQTDGFTLSDRVRDHIDQRIRLIVGARAARVDAVRLSLGSASDAGTRVRCSVKPKDADRAFELRDEVAENPETAAELAIWRLRHFLDRHALRSEPGRQSA